MLWLALVRYALTGQVVWVQDGPDIHDVWCCRILLVLPDALVIESACTGDHDAAAYQVTLPLREVRAVREAFPARDRERFDHLFQHDTDGPGPDGEPARIK